MYIPELKAFEYYGTVISAICKDIDSISGFPYVCVYYDNPRYRIAALKIDLNTDNISLAKYDVRIFYI